MLAAQTNRASTGHDIVNQDVYGNKEWPDYPVSLLTYGATLRNRCMVIDWIKNNLTDIEMIDAPTCLDCSASIQAMPCIRISNTK